MQQNISSQNGGPRPRIEPQYVRFVGDSVGVVNLTPSALQLLSDQVTQLLCKIINTSKQYTLHGRRMKLQADDVDATLNLLKLNIPYGAASKKGPQLRQFTAPNGEELFVPEEFDIDIATIADEPKPKYPVQSFIKAHWLAYEGKLALVPENLRPVKEEEDDDVGINGESIRATVVAHRRETAGGSHGASVAFRQTCRTVQIREQVQVRAPLVESLTVEQQLYIKQVVEAVVCNEDEPKRTAALHSLTTDTGLQPILPKLSLLVSQTVRYNIITQSIPMLIYMVRICKALVENTSLKLDGVLHELIPTLLSCILCSRLCRPDLETHWVLRDYAGKTLGDMILLHGTDDLRERTLRVIKQAWQSPDATIQVKFGCVNPLLSLLSIEDRFNTVFMNDLRDLEVQAKKMQDDLNLNHIDRATGSRVSAHLAKADIIKKSRERKDKVIVLQKQLHSQFSQDHELMDFAEVR